MTDAPSKAAIERARKLTTAEPAFRCEEAALNAFARYIDAHEPQLRVDPDLATAREAVARHWKAMNRDTFASEVRAGLDDMSESVKIALAAIKLAKERDHD